jgi:hypothetical protein
LEFRVWASMRGWKEQREPPTFQSHTRPELSHTKIFNLSARFARKTKTSPANGSADSVSFTSVERLSESDGWPKGYRPSLLILFVVFRYR